MDRCERYRYFAGNDQLIESVSIECVHLDVLLLQFFYECFALRFDHAAHHSGRDIVVADRQFAF